jgi:citrate lyase subunit beta/citryl-CoA lyase
VRSLLFVPGDDPRKLDRALAAGADAVILDLEDSVSLEKKEEARRLVLGFLQENDDARGRPRLYVRINALSTPFCEGDLDAVMTGAPDGIVLPKAGGGSDIALLHARLSVREALHGLADGRTQIVAIATESARALFTLGTYGGVSTRLAGLAWGAEDLSADIGALAARAEGTWTEPFRLARNFCLFGAAAAGVSAVDTVYTDFRDLEGLKGECEAAARDGFSGKLAIHPDQVPVINEAFAPAPGAVLRAEQIVAAFAAAGDAGVISLDGVMLDRPHLKAAKRLLARAVRKVVDHSENAGS